MAAGFRGDDRQMISSHFDRFDIDGAAADAREAALIGGDAGGNHRDRAVVDGAAAGKRKHRESGAAVVGKGAKPGVELVGRSCQ